jgi:hypothetical protein
VWAYLVSPKTEQLRWPVLTGGVLILTALLTSILVKHDARKR